MLDENRTPHPISNIEKGLKDEITKEIESGKKEDEGYEGFDMEYQGGNSTFIAKAEQAAKEAREMSNKDDNKRLKDVVDDYMVQLQKGIKEGIKEISLAAF
jgi:flagellar motility protein MotE (MotC chaperone)